MAAKTLNKEQRDEVLRMLGARETYQTIADAVGCSWDNVKYYAVKYADEINKAREAYDAQFIGQGLRSWSKRVEKLERLADRIEKTLEEPAKDGKGGRGLWVDDIKMAGNGDTEDVKVFAGEAIRQYRGLLDDIAKETGGRVTKQDLNISGLDIVVHYADSKPDDTETLPGPAAR